MTAAAKKKEREKKAKEKAKNAKDAIALMPPHLQPPKEQRPTRIVSAKELRIKMAKVRASPEGPVKVYHPDLYAACVVCPNCSCPVWWQQAEVATDETFINFKDFERPKFDEDDPFAHLDDLEAENMLDQEEEEEEQGDEEGEDEEDEESITSEERMERELERLNKALEDAGKEKVDLNTRVEELEKTKEDQEQKIAELNDKIEFLQASEIRWRQKYQDVKAECEKHLETITGLKDDIDSLEEQVEGLEGNVEDLEDQLDMIKVKRETQLDGLEEVLDDKEKAAMKLVQLVTWRMHFETVKIRRKFEATHGEIIRELEKQYERVKELESKIEDAEAERARTEKQRKEIAMLMVKRTLRGGDKYQISFAWQAWLGVHGQVRTENALEVLEAKAATLRAAYDKLMLEKLELEKICADQKVELSRRATMIVDLREELHSTIEMWEARYKALQEEMRERLETQFREMNEERERQLAEQDAEFRRIERHLNDEIDNLEMMLESKEAAASGKKPKARVVPRGRGQLCMGCMKQLLFRDVKPLSAEGALGLMHGREGFPHGLERAEQMVTGFADNFFNKEMAATLDPNDKFHRYVWQTHKDPIGITPAPARKLGIETIRAEFCESSPPADKLKKKKNVSLPRPGSVGLLPPSTPKSITNSGKELRDPVWGNLPTTPGTEKARQAFQLSMPGVKSAWR